MIRITFIASNLEIGGVQSQWYELIKGLDRARFEPSLICLYDLGRMGREIEKLGVPCRSDLMRSRFSVGGFGRLVKQMREQRTDVAFIWSQPLTMFYGPLAARFAGVRAVVTAIHSTGYIERRSRNFWANRFFSRFVDRIVAVGNSQRDYLVNEMRLPEDKTVTIFNGVDTDRFAASVDRSLKKAELGIPPETKVVGIIGRLHPCKRHDLFLEAAKQIIQQEPLVYFLIVGDGEERGSIEKMIRDLSLESYVKILGFRRDIAEINRILDISVLASSPVIETLPMTIIESMASSVPVIATNVGSLSDLIHDGENGFLVPVGDVNKLASAITKLLKDPALAGRMGERGRQIAAADFSLPVMVKAYQSLFESLCREDGREVKR